MAESMKIYVSYIMIILIIIICVSCVYIYIYINPFVDLKCKCCNKYTHIYSVHATLSARNKLAMIYD